MRSPLQALSLLLLLWVPLHAGFIGDLFQSTPTPPQKTHKPTGQPLPYEEYLRPSSQKGPNSSVDQEEPQPAIRSKSLFLSYLQPPKTLYVGAHHAITVRALIAASHIASLSARFSGGRDLKVLNPASTWHKVSDREYRATFYYKPLSAHAKLPRIRVTVTRTGATPIAETLSPFTPSVIALPPSENFSGVICHTFALLGHHEKSYDEGHNIVVMEINATRSNLEEFHLPYATRQGIDQIKNDGIRQYIYYFAILPSRIKKIRFSYFQLPQKRYRTVSFEMKLTDSSISTQTDLNPRKSRLQHYKQIAELAAAALFLLLFLLYRKWWLLLIALMIGIYLLYAQARIQKVLLPAGTKIKILPTENSTIFYTTPNAVQADLLLRKRGYIKVMLPNKKIGWIKAP